MEHPIDVEETGYPTADGLADDTTTRIHRPLGRVVEQVRKEVGHQERPSAEEIAEHINKMLAVLDSKVLWVNPDCGLKTRKYSEVKSALSNMVAAAKLIRSQLNKS